jgi:cytidylate kinase
MMDHYVITIARGFGSGGKEIGSILAKRLEIPCYERQILTLASQTSGIVESEFVRQDERLKKVDILGFLKKEPFPSTTEATEKTFRGNRDLFEIQAEIIRQLADTQSCIIIGKCADYILRDYKNVVSVYIEAPRKACLESIMKKMHVSEKKGHELIRKTDKYRADYYKYYTNGGYWTNPVNYDMTLNSDRVGRETCADIIEHYLKMKMGI